MEYVGVPFMPTCLKSADNLLGRYIIVIQGQTSSYFHVSATASFQFPPPWFGAQKSCAGKESMGREDWDPLAAHDPEQGQAAGAAVRTCDDGTPPRPSSNNNDKNIEPAGEQEEGMALKVLTYGAVNAMMAIPILYGYAAIIFRCTGLTLVEILTERHLTTSTCLRVSLLVRWCVV